MRTTLGMFATAAMLAGCGGDDGGIAADSTCGLAIITSGAIAADVDGGNEPACLTQFSSDTGTDGELLLLSDPSTLTRVRVVVEDVGKGATGSFPAAIGLFTDDTAWGSVDCTAAVTENRELEPREFGTGYRVRGSVTCPAPLPNDDGGAATTITHLEWVYSPTWTD